MGSPRMPGGAVFYEGPSRIDGKPIVALAPFKVSSNTKTGPMLKTYILAQDLDPVSAIRTGLDFAVCGNCKLRGVLDGLKVKGRSCYVEVGKSVLSIWKAWKRGRYVPLVPSHRAWLNWRPIRRGSYGDPAAVPADAWAQLMSIADNDEWGTGYTHQWQTDESTKDSCMASVDSPTEREAAKKAGWRTFRIRGPSDPLLEGEVACPASEEGGYKSTCYQCQLCNGAGGFGGRPDVAIIVHGFGKGNFATV